MPTKSKITKGPESYNISLVNGNNETKRFANSPNGSKFERPYRINPETAEDRDKRLEKRKALTLRAFGIAFDNKAARKTS